MFEYKIVYSKRRTVCITVESGGEVVVKAPTGYGISEVQKFVSSKSKWIENAISKEKSKIKPPDFLGGEEFCFCGRGGNRVIFCDKKRSRYDAGDRIFYIPANARSENLGCSDKTGGASFLFRKTAKNEFLKFAATRTETIAKACGFCYGKISVGSARTRWGVCNANNDITYSLYLSFLPIDLIDYVILHELCHVKQKNHSRAFWALVCRFMPDAKSRRKKLHEYSLYLAV